MNLQKVRLSTKANPKSYILYDSIYIALKRQKWRGGDYGKEMNIVVTKGQHQGFL